MKKSIRERILKREIERAFSEGLPVLLFAAAIILFYSFK